MQRLTVYLVALLVAICCLQSMAFPLDASDYVPYPTSGPAVSTGSGHTVGLKTDGRVLAVGDTINGQLNVGGWDNIVQVSAGSFHTVGLRADGRVVAVGDNDGGQLNVGSWENIVQVSAGLFHTVGLRADGRVVAVGDNEEGQLDVGGWENIVQVSAGSFHTVGLHADGSAVAASSTASGKADVGSWENIVQVSAGSSHTVGVREDGSAVAVGSNTAGQLNVGDWENIVQVSAGGTHTVGLKTDGSVVAVGSNDDGQSNVGGWFLGEPATTTTSTPQVTTTTTTTAPFVTTSTTTSQPLSELYSISGHVTGDIIAGISVKLTGASSQTLRTDANGYYLFSNRTGGEYYTITPEHEGYEFEPQHYVIQSLTSDLTDMDFVSTRVETTPCPLEAMYGEDSEEVEVLRYVRDNLLNQTRQGREIIQLYYQWSPVIVRLMEEDEDFKADSKEMIDGILQIIR